MADRKKGHTRESNASVAEGQEETPKPSVTFLSSYTGLGAPDRRAKKTFSFSGLNLNIPENRASPSMKPTRPVFGVSAPGVKPPFTHPPTMRPPTSNGEMCKTSKTVHSTPMSATARIPPTLSPAPWQGQMPPGKTMVGSALVSQEQQISGTQEPFTLMPRRFIPEQVQLPQQFGSVTPHVASKQKLTNFTSNVRQTQQEKTVTRDALRIEAFELGSMEGPISGFEDDPLERFTTNVKQESIFDLDCLPEDIDFNEAPSETTKRRRTQGGFRQRKFNNGSHILGKPKKEVIDKNLSENMDFKIQDCICPGMEVFDCEDLNYCQEDFVECLSVENNDLDFESYVHQNTEYQLRKEKYTKDFLENGKEFAVQLLESRFHTEKECNGSNCTSGNGKIFCGSGCGFLCHDCDIIIHSRCIHSRYFHGIKLHSGLDSNGKRFEVILDLAISKLCTFCNTKLQVQKSTGTLKVVTLTGVFEVNCCQYECSYCENVENVKYSLTDFFSRRLFPMNCDPQSNILCSFEVMDQWRILKNASTVTALYSYIQCLSEDSVHKIDQMKFDMMYQQYQHLRQLIDIEIFGINDFECIAKLAPQSFHLDGDLKCKHLKLNQNDCDETQTYYGSKFFVPDSEVQKVTEYCVGKKLCSKKLSDVKCGTSSWKAAGNTLNTKPSPVDIKGLQLASCTHLINVAACNLPYGELFANNLLLLRKIFKSYTVEVAGSDVACKFSPWFQKIGDDSVVCEELDLDPQNIDIFLGDLHSKGHSLDCRLENGVIWNNVGRLQGLEMQEPANNPFSRGRHRTAFQTLNRRQDEYSEMAYVINQKRNKDMIFTLIKRMNRILKEIKDCHKKLNDGQSEHSIRIDEDTITRVKSSAINMRSKAKSDFENDVEFHSLGVAVKKMQLKKTNDPGHKQNVLRNLNSETKKLNQLIADNNNDPTKIKLNWNECLDGIFPWTAKLLPQEAQSNPSKFIELCETYLKVKNSIKELSIIERDIGAILQNRVNIINNLSTDRECFSPIVNQARSEKQLQLCSQLIDEIQAVKDTKKLNINTDIYLEQLDLDKYPNPERPTRENQKEKLIAEAEGKMQDMMISDPQLDDIMIVMHEG